MLDYVEVLALLGKLMETTTLSSENTHMQNTHSLMCVRARTHTRVFIIQGGQPWVVRLMKAGALPAPSIVSGT